MKREYTEGTVDGITFFIGDEIERTPAYGMKTLFVVGVHEPQDILDLLQTKLSYSVVTHIYFGANQSFPTLATDDADEWRPWERMIDQCLDAGYWCTLDFDVSVVQGVLEMPVIGNRRFIPQISVKLPYLQQLGYNATIKLDDIDFEYSNPGVWCHSLHSLTTRETFTDWDQYGKDEIIK
jgi:hypothetical protein